jgi:hypothetical protein
LLKKYSTALENGDCFWPCIHTQNALRISYIRALRQILVSL